MAQILIESLHQPTLEAQHVGLDASRVRYFTAHPQEIAVVLVYQNPVGGERIPVNGHHRLEAARRLGWKRIDADLWCSVPGMALTAGVGKGEGFTHIRDDQGRM